MPLTANDSGDFFDRILADILPVLVDVWLGVPDVVFTDFLSMVGFLTKEGDLIAIFNFPGPAFALPLPEVAGDLVFFFVVVGDFTVFFRVDAGAFEGLFPLTLLLDFGVALPFVGTREGALNK